jgi:hypothetical protein
MKREQGPQLLYLLPRRPRRWMATIVLRYVMVMVLVLVQYQFHHSNRTTDMLRQQNLMPFHHDGNTELPPPHDRTKDSTTTHLQQHDDTNKIVVDIISTGSITRFDFLSAQQQTFGHYVRNFWSITEETIPTTTTTTPHGRWNDCSKHLTLEQYHSVIDFCTTRPWTTSVITVGQFLRSKLFRPKYNVIPTTTTTRFHSNRSQPIFTSTLHIRKNTTSHPAIGWLCAQQRPMIGLQIALDAYTTTTTTTTQQPSSLPHYLILIDDDTYLQLDHFIQPTVTVVPSSSSSSPQQQQPYPYNEIHVVAGCKKQNPQKIHFTFPFGGYGTIFTLAALQERFFLPIDCQRHHTVHHDVGDNAVVSYPDFVCWQIYQNHIGEMNFFENGMSVSQLYIQYALQQPYTNIEQWNKSDIGYCFHSDHILAYFVNYYHVGTTDIPQIRRMEPELLNVSTVLQSIHDDPYIRLLHHYHNSNNSEMISSFRSLHQCDNKGDECFNPTRNCTICHNIHPQQMYTQWNKISHT